MTDSGIVRTALVGYGLGGSVFHAPFIAAEARMELAFVVSSRPDKRAEVQARYPGVVGLASFSDLVEVLDGIDLAVVSTPNITHVALAEALFRRGCHVVVDKPVAPTSEQVRHLIEVSRAAGRHLVPFQNRRWDGDFQTVRSLLRAGTLGAVHRFESRYERWQPVMSAGPERSWKRDGSAGHATGILYDLGTHLIDQAVALYGRPSHVYAEVEIRRADTGVDDDVFLALSYPDGPEVHLWASAVAADQGPRFRVLGGLGAFVKFGMDPQEAALGVGRLPTEPGWGEEPRESWGVLTAAGGSRPEPTLPRRLSTFLLRTGRLLDPRNSTSGRPGGRRALRPHHRGGPAVRGGAGHRAAVRFYAPGWANSVSTPSGHRRRAGTSRSTSWAFPSLVTDRSSLRLSILAVSMINLLG